MLKIFVPVTFNPGWGWVIFKRFHFKEPRREEGLKADDAPNVRGMEGNEINHLFSRPGGGAGGTSCQRRVYLSSTS